jgi:hypothetical protein
MPWSCVAYAAACVSRMNVKIGTQVQRAICTGGLIFSTSLGSMFLLREVVHGVSLATLSSCLRSLKRNPSPPVRDAAFDDARSASASGISDCDTGSSIPQNSETKVGNIRSGCEVEDHWINTILCGFSLYTTTKPHEVLQW